MPADSNEKKGQPPAEGEVPAEEGAEVEEEDSNMEEGEDEMAEGSASEGGEEELEENEEMGESEMDEEYSMGIKEGNKDELAMLRKQSSVGATNQKGSIQFERKDSFSHKRSAHKLAIRRKHSMQETRLRSGAVVTTTAQVANASQ